MTTLDTRGPTVVVLAIGALSIGCKGPDLTLAATQAVRWTEQAEGDAALTALFYAGAIHAETPEAMAQDAAAAITAAMAPGCLPAPKVEGAKATFTFDHCEAQGDSHGVESIQGKVIASYRINDATGDLLGVDLDTEGLVLDGLARDRSLTANNVFPASSWAGSPAKERAFHLAEKAPALSATESRDALTSFDGSFEPPPACVFGDASPPRIGAASGLVRVDDGSAWAVSAGGVLRCGSRCPREGFITAQLEIAVRVDLDGTETALATDLGSGETARVPLSCKP